jgi:H+/Cl- antiporter ClcA
MPPINFNHRENTALSWTLVKWGVLGAWVGIVAGIASAVFLHALDWATATRDGHPWLLFLLPIAGLAIGWVYDRFGKSVAAGNNLLLERIHSQEATAIPFRMVPLVLIGTVVTHLFGGSAGREGTAVQMGGTLANLATGPLKLSARDHRLLIMSGISGGFGSVFGTPLAGAVFGMEVLSVGKMGYEALVPCLVASIVGDIVCRALGVHHHIYSVGVSLPAQTPWLWLLIVAASALFACAAALFGELTHGISHIMKERVKIPALRPVIGGIAIIGLTYLVGTRDYLGLSLPLIAKSFTPEGVVLWAFALKILFTAVTLGTGFKGGEVTPLFGIGAALGAAFAHLTGQPTAFFAALGFVAVFAGAANTPLACTIMGIELFGSPMAVPLFAACIVAYVLSGHRGIYLSQLVGVPKAHDVHVADGTLLRDARDGRMRIRLARHPFLPRRQTLDNLDNGNHSTPHNGQGQEDESDV